MVVNAEVPDITDNLTLFKSIYSVVALIFSISLVMGLIFTEQTKVSSQISPILAVVTVWVAIIWLTMVEGGQASLVGLTPINFDLYKTTHKKTHSITKVCFTGDNLDRYLLGRQFLVVLTVFTVNNTGGPIKGAELWGLPSWVQTIFLSSGLAMILFTCMVGQLNSQVNATLCMLDYSNNAFALIVFWVSMGIEFSGVLHASYLLNMIVCYLAGKPVESKEPPKNAVAFAFFAIAYHIKLIMFLYFECKSFSIITKFQSAFYHSFIWSFFFPVNYCKLFKSFFISFSMFHCIGKTVSIRTEN